MAASHHFSARSRSGLNRLPTNIKDADLLARLEQSFGDFLPVFPVAPMSAVKLDCVRLADPSVYPDHARSQTCRRSDFRQRYAASRFSESCRRFERNSCSEVSSVSSSALRKLSIAA